MDRPSKIYQSLRVQVSNWARRSDQVRWGLNFDEMFWYLGYSCRCQISFAVSDSLTLFVSLFAFASMSPRLLSSFSLPICLRWIHSLYLSYLASLAFDALVTPKQTYSIENVQTESQPDFHFLPPHSVPNPNPGLNRVPWRGEEKY